MDSTPESIRLAAALDLKPDMEQMPHLIRLSSYFLSYLGDSHDAGRKTVSLYTILKTVIKLTAIADVNGFSVNGKRLSAIQES
ncbi:hypothetical protein ACWGNA_11345 [Brucella cytisi]|uniref:hypothetical protein n=1 Tax=Brucella cytisi TaxID=407152 RepID=UPI0035E20D4A